MNTSVWVYECTQVYTSVQIGESKQCVFMYNKSSENIGALFVLYSIYFFDFNASSIFNTFGNIKCELLLCTKADTFVALDTILL